MEKAKPAQLLTLAPNATTSLLAVDESKQAVYYVVRTPARPGPPARSLCGQSAQGAESLVKASFGSGKDPTVVLAQPNGWCFGRSSPALDAKRGLLYYSLQDQYSMFMVNKTACQRVFLTRPVFLTHGVCCRAIRISPSST